MIKPEKKNCRKLQNALLAGEVDAEGTKHLAECASCREFARMLEEAMSLPEPEFATPEFTPIMERYRRESLHLSGHSILRRVGLGLGAAAALAVGFVAARWTMMSEVPQGIGGTAERVAVVARGMDAEAEASSEQDGYAIALTWDDDELEQQMADLQPEITRARWSVAAFDPLNGEDL